MFFPGLARQGRLASGFSCSRTESTPAPAPVTQTVGQSIRTISVLEEMEEEMDESKGEILEILVEIRDTLNRIFVCFEDEYIEIQKRKYGEKVKAFEAMLTDSRKKMFPFLFDRRHLSQVEIAQAAGVTQSAVSKFINLLIKNGFIEQTAEADKIIYLDKYDLLKFLQK